MFTVTILNSSRTVMASFHLNYRLPLTATGKGVGEAPQELQERGSRREDKDFSPGIHIYLSLPQKGN